LGFSFNTVESDYLNEYISVRTAIEISGYNQQYLRHLLRGNIYQSKKKGQLWLTQRHNCIDFLKKADQVKDKRFGPH